MSKDINKISSSLISRNNAIILQIDPTTGQILDANESASRFYGWSHEELCAKHIQDINQLDADQVAAERQAAAREERKYFVFPHRLANGETRTVEVHSTPIAVEGKTILVSIIHDISERVRYAEQVEHLLMEQNAILSSDIVGIVKLKDRKFVWSNDAYAEMLGYTKEELIGLPTRTVYPSDQAYAEFFEAAYPVMQRNEIFRTEIQYQTKNGDIRWYRISGGLLAPGSSESIWAFVDITERKEAEAELSRYRSQLEDLVESRTADLSLAKEAAETSSRAKTAFLANMSHELRTPMNGIMGMTAVALRSTSDPKLKDYLGKISQSSERLLDLINNILDIVWIESERFDLKPKGFDLYGVLGKLTRQHGSIARKKGLTFAIDVAPELEKRPLNGDALRLGQLLAHLTSNAIKITDKGTVIVRITVAEETPDEVLMRFEVRDTGIGIPAELQQPLFRAFEQADTSMTRKFSGTGLGLTLSKRLAHAMGGSIGVESRPGEGSVFWFTVRLAKIALLIDTEPVKDPRSAEEILITSYANARVLLVEDEPFNQEVTKILMEEVGLRVDVANDGAEAVEMSKETDYDLILMDLRMPVLNGVEATRQIRKLPGRSKTPILALTASVFAKDSETCFAAGMNDFIGKPVDPEKLFAALLKWLEKADQ